MILFWLWSSLELSQFLTSNRLQMLLRTLTLHRLFYSSVCVRVCVRATSSECYSGSVSGVNQLVTLVWSAGIWVEINICALCSRSSILISVFFLAVFLFHSDWKQMCGGCLQLCICHCWGLLYYICLAASRRSENGCALLSFSTFGFCTLSSTNVWTATRWSFWLLALIILDGNDTMALAFKCRLSALLWGQRNNSDGLFGLWSRVKCKPWPVPVFSWCSSKITSDCSCEQPGKGEKRDGKIHPPSVEDLKLS